MKIIFAHLKFLIMIIIRDFSYQNRIDLGQKVGENLGRYGTGSGFSVTLLLG